jgi:hypothetical protein
VRQIIEQAQTPVDLISTEFANRYRFAQADKKADM